MAEKYKLTCLQKKRYNACIMIDKTTQITVRGLDPNTKAALEKKAAKNGLSLNKYTLATLRQAAGTDTSEERYHKMTTFIANHRIPANELQQITQALDWADKTSTQKQQRDERDLSI